MFDIEIIFFTSVLDHLHGQLADFHNDNIYLLIFNTTISSVQFTHFIVIVNFGANATVLKNFFPIHYMCLYVL